MYFEEIAKHILNYPEDNFFNILEYIPSNKLSWFITCMVVELEKRAPQALN